MATAASIPTIAFSFPRRAAFSRRPSCPTGIITPRSQAADVTHASDATRGRPITSTTGGSPSTGRPRPCRDERDEAHRDAAGAHERTAAHRRTTDPAAKCRGGDHPHGCRQPRAVPGQHCDWAMRASPSTRPATSGRPPAPDSAARRRPPPTSRWQEPHQLTDQEGQRPAAPKPGHGQRSTARAPSTRRRSWAASRGDRCPSAGCAHSCAIEPAGQESSTRMKPVAMASPMLVGASVARRSRTGDRGRPRDDVPHAAQRPSDANTRNDPISPAA